MPDDGYYVDKDREKVSIHHFPHCCDRACVSPENESVVMEYH